MILVIRVDVVLPESWNKQQIKKEITKGALAKYVLSNNAFHPDIIKKKHNNRKVRFDKAKKIVHVF